MITEFNCLWFPWGRDSAEEYPQPSVADLEQYWYGRISTASTRQD